jgi:BirA family transcriptional regulator, biotin operon repressor / biotin---[acetyl-CoA-carboxylase] ligase
MTSRWSDLSRPPLSATRLDRAFAHHPVWREVQLLIETESTNALAGAAVRDGAAEGLVILAEEQTSGRGRLDRTWQSPPRAGILMSMVLRPTVSPASWPLLSLLAGLSVVEAVVAVGKVDAVLKWPNDVLFGGKKLGGILAERVEDAVVVGVGLNVSTRAEELPVEQATSVAIAVKEVLRAFGRRYVEWRDTFGDASSVLPAYRERCETIGHQVRIDLPAGDVVTGIATDVDDEGCLVVRDDHTGTERAWRVGDVTHVRRATEGYEH